MSLKSIKHFWRTIKYRYYRFFKYKNPENFKRLVDNNRQKAIDLTWQMVYGKKFPWKHPVTLNEKITWLSGMTDTSKWTEYSDKYAVRNHLKELGLEHILTKCYGVWNKVEDIDYSLLPDSFAIKCTHDCGSTVIVKNKSQMNIEETNNFLRARLGNIMGYNSCEPHYTKIIPRIMAEELIPLPEGGGQV